MSREKIAILGGGVSAMTAAVYLTEQENWQQKYDLTVYQLGWRLGGKGASGRNAQMGERIEEHGLHVWFGAYVNSFRAIENVYNKLNRPSDMPLSTWQEAFKPHSFVVLQEFIDNEWQTWPIDFPVLEGNPADGTLDLHFWQLIEMTVAWLRKFISTLEEEVSLHHKKTKLQTTKRRDRSLLQHLATQVRQAFDDVEDEVEDFFQSAHDELREIWSTPSMLSQQLQRLVNLRATDKDLSDSKDRLVVWYLVRKLKRWLNSEAIELLDDNPNIRRAYVCADLGIAVLIGLIKDKVFSKGFSSINNIDFKAWLAKNGANKQYTVESAPVRGFYDLVFGYVDGDFEKGDVEAGVATLAMLRLMLCYRGGVMWKMQAGMGDVIFAPIYELLKSRGVKFEFFNQVDELLPGIDQQGNHVVEQINITEQVTLVDESYQPFVFVKGLPCWPDRPLLDQILPEQAQLIEQHNINLESFWSDWANVYQTAFGQPLPTKTLRRGVDFDKVIFGISVASLNHLCPELLQLDSKLNDQATKVKTVATQAFQIWLNKTDEQLGFNYSPPSEERPILSGFSQPFDTWAAMSNLVDKEDWPSNGPNNIAYFCSAFGCETYPSKSHHNFPTEQKAKVKENALDKLRTEMQPLWPSVYNQQQFDWSVLYAPAGDVGEQRFDSQYWRVNVDPSERYVLSVTGSSQYRLATDGSIFANLYLTGDWIQTGVNAGCVEAAVMAGMQTSRSLCGIPSKISGEDGFEPDGA
ncbi:NAD(P)-binding protein [Pseudoalteromonas sp. JBTF-M23]|uniref:NAD(P)-binding protein n=1 Tax=Pseudoalteromonas caenipelagi TaxID=2726988 RepID=A0A849V8R5_9GAMM|nr:NAD(P)-binding protein [Pseudoalteromonas caenipelagi]NOU49318.1 NAD(P)-binding protein [Pseudoalteromonas caenipelagi]